MSTVRTERLVNLVICLLSTRQYLSAERIRATVAGYDTAPTDDAFFRMFERDKTELRELGVPLERGRSSIHDDADGYRIARRDYELPEIELEPDEAAALALASRLWESPQLAGAARNAVLKLRAAGVEVDTAAVAGLETRVPIGEVAFDPLVAAVQNGRAVTFTHRPDPASPSTRRSVQPWGVVSHRGRWYLVGFDTGRDAVRCFRVSRIDEVRAVGPAGAVIVPEGTDLTAITAASAGAVPSAVTARLRVSAGRARGLRRGAVVVHEDPGTTVLDVVLPSLDAGVRLVAGYGPDVVVIDPPELRTAVLDTLRGAVGGAVGAVVGT